MRHVPLLRIAALALFGLLLSQAASSAWLHAHGTAHAFGDRFLAAGEPTAPGSEGAVHDPLACEACRLRADGDRPALALVVSAGPDAGSSTRLVSRPGVAPFEELRSGPASARAPPVRS